MLSRRIIPCLDMKGGRVVKGVNFEGLRDCGDPVEMAKRYYKEGADELAFLDISASSQGRGNATELASMVSREVFIPFMVGGGISLVSDIGRVLGAGADKVSINTSAVLDPGLISRAADAYGCQCVVVAIDARRRQAGLAGLVAGESAWEVMIYGGKRQSGLDALSWARRAVELGAGEVLLTSMDEDGVRGGYDIELTRAVAEAVEVPVIASGGAGSLEDFYCALTEGKADAALAASLFHNEELSIGQVKEYLDRRGVPVRLGH